MKKLVYILLFVFIGQPLLASHFMGGEIAWECLPNGNYRFILTVYRECAGIDYPNVAELESNSPAGTISLYLYPNPTAAKEDISPDCNSDPAFPHIECATTPSGYQYANSGAIEKWTYTTDQDYPSGVQLQGVPPASGWYFAFDGCCRNPSTNIQSANSMAWYLRAIMYPDNGANAMPCIHDSPVFLENPKTVLCTGYPFSFQQNVSHVGYDSLRFSWVQPLDGSLNAPVTYYSQGYSYTSPLPGTFHNPANVNAVMDPETGEVSFTSHTQGAFVSVTKVTAFRNGNKVAEIFREIQFVLLACGANMPPEVEITKLPSGLALSQTSPTSYTDTVYVGDTVNFKIEALDTIPILLPNGDLSIISMEAYSPHFGQDYISDTSGCLVPPCATLNPPPPQSDSLGVLSHLNWAVGVDHYLHNYNLLNQPNQGLPYFDFNFSFKDDFCPAPGLSSIKLRLYVSDTNIDAVSVNRAYCINKQNPNDIGLEWHPMTDPDSLFLYYKLFRKNSASQTYSLIDSFTSIDDTSYIDPGAVASNPEYKVVAGYGYNNIVYETQVFQGKLMELQSDAQLCQNKEFQTELLVQGQNYDSIHWNFGGATIISGNGSGPFMLHSDTPGQLIISAEVFSDCGTNTFFDTLFVNAFGPVHISGPRYFCPGKTLILNASGGDEYLWSTGHTTATLLLPHLMFPLSLSITVTDTSTGCSITKPINIREIQTYQQSKVCMVSTGIAEQMNKITISNDPMEDIKSYKIHYKADPADPYQVLKTVGSQQLVVWDSTNDPSQGQYYYAVQVVDSCDQTSGISAPVSPVYLQGELANGLVSLLWTLYEGSSTYSSKVYKKTIPNGSYQPIHTLPQGQKIFQESYIPNTYVSYLIGTHPFSCGVGNTDTISYSNAYTVNNVGIIEHDNDPCELLIINDGDNTRAQLSWTQGRMKESILEIHDLLGREYGSMEVGKTAKEVIDLGHLPEGVLLYSIYSKEGMILKGKFLR